MIVVSAGVRKCGQTGSVSCVRIVRHERDKLCEYHAIQKIITVYCSPYSFLVAIRGREKRGLNFSPLEFKSGHGGNRKRTVAETMCWRRFDLVLA